MTFVPRFVLKPHKKCKYILFGIFLHIQTTLLCYQGLSVSSTHSSSVTRDRENAILELLNYFYLHFGVLLICIFFSNENVLFNLKH